MFIPFWFLVLISLVIMLKTDTFIPILGIGLIVTVLAVVFGTASLALLGLACYEPRTLAALIIVGVGVHMWYSKKKEKVSHD